MSDLSNVRDVHDRLTEIQLVDCREPYEWEAGRVEGAIHIPVNSIMAGAGGDLDKEKPVAVICHATCALLKARLSDGSLLVEGKTWTGFANSEEDFADDYVGQQIQPFRIEDEARKLDGTNFIVASRFKAHAVRDGLLITGQQQYSGAAAARLLVEALGV